MVQINNSFSGQDYFPLSVGLLQAYVQARASRPARYEFLMPVFRREPLRELEDRLGDVDVAAFSLYVWNARYSLELARRLKKRKPGMLVVVGGPQVPGNPEDFLRAHPYVDIVCHGEGEETFLEILERYPSRDWSGLQAVSHLAVDGGFQHHRRVGRVASLEGIPSPYLAGTFDRLITAYPGHQWLGLWETNRGCPYRCAFCEWGAAEMNRVYHFDDPRLAAELEWFALHRVEFIFCCDSNFGMFPRDLTIAERVVEMRQRHGYPRAFSIQSSKSAPERVYRISRLLNEHGLSKGVLLALQSVHPPTLEAIHRNNVSMRSFEELQLRFRREGVQTFTDLILGLPEETYESFADGVSSIIANGQHNRIQFINLSILDNAEMGQSAYREKYGLETVESVAVNIHGLVHELDGVEPETQRLVIATKTMPREAWVKTRVFSWMTALLHFDKLLPIPFVVLREVFGLNYRECIEAFMGVDPGQAPIVRGIVDFFTRRAREIQQGGPEYHHCREWLDIWWPDDEYNFIELCVKGRLPEFYAEARLLLRGLAQRAGAKGGLGFIDDAIALNCAILKLPTPGAPSRITLGSNVFEVYRRALLGEKAVLREGPCRYDIIRSGRWEMPWEQWCREVVWYGNKRGDYLHAVEPVLEDARP